MSLKVELQNIGGLRGKHSFSFEKGLNVLKSPNASGKSSLLNAFYLILANESLSQSELKDYLTDNEVGGYVRITDEQGQKSEIRLTRNASDEVELSRSEINISTEPRLNQILSFLREKSKINAGIQSADELIIENWFQDVTNVNKYHNVWTIAQDLSQKLESKVESLKGKQSEDIGPSQNLREDKEQQLQALQAEKEKIVSDPNNQKNEREIKELNKELEKVDEDFNKIKAELLEFSNEGDVKEEIKIKETNIETLEEKLKNIESERESSQIERQKWEQRVIDLTKKIQNLKIQITQIKNDRAKCADSLKDKKKLKDRSVCPLCNSQIDRAETARQMKELEATLDGFIEEEEKLERQKNNLESDKKTAQSKAKELADKIKYSPQKISDEIQKLKKEVQELKNSLKETKKRRTELEGALEEKNSEKNAIEERIRENLNPAFKDKIEKLEKEIRNLGLEIEELDVKINKFLKENEELRKFEKRYNVANKIQDYYRTKVEIIRKIMVKKINDQLEKSFELLNLAELERITLDPDHFKITIQRKDKSYTSLEKMSGAERALIAVIISYIVKKTVLPNDPIFLIDEVTSEMDDTRFKDILDYISNEILYLIVSRHSPYQGERETLTPNMIYHEI